MDEARAIKIEFLRRTVASQRFTLRFQLSLAIGVILLGVVLLLAMYKLGGPQAFEASKWLLTLAGGFVATVAGFPLKEMGNKKDKIAALIFLLQGYERLPSGAGEESQVSWLDDRFRALVDKGLGG